MLKGIVFGAAGLVIALGLTGCNVEVSDSDDYVAKPAVYAFNMVDSYKTNSEFEDEHLALSPYLYGGDFELFWDVGANQSYSLDIYVNDRPYLDNDAVLVSHDDCSTLNSCHREQYQYCEYSANMNMYCTTASGDSQSGYIGHVVSQLPQDVYFILDACDTFSGLCESRTLQVLLE